MELKECSNRLGRLQVQKQPIKFDNVSSAEN